MKLTHYFFLSFFGFYYVAFSNFSLGESPGRSALETGSKREEESLIEFLGWQVSLRKRGLEFSCGLLCESLTKRSALSLYFTSMCYGLIHPGQVKSLDTLSRANKVVINSYC